MTKKEKKPGKLVERPKMHPDGKGLKRHYGCVDGFRGSTRIGGLNPSVCGDGDGFPGGIEFASEQQLHQLAEVLGRRKLI